MVERAEVRINVDYDRQQVNGIDTEFQDRHLVWADGEGKWYLNRISKILIFVENAQIRWTGVCTGVEGRL